MSATRMLFSPVNELGVVTLFAMYHRELGDGTKIVEVEKTFLRLLWSDYKA
jgi:hypothetical protein